MVKGKVKIITGRPVAVAVAAGDVEIGIQQTNVIQPVAGTDLSRARCRRS